MRLARAAGLLAGLTAVAVLGTGCGVSHLQNLNFRVDHRLHFVSPKDRSTAHLPLTLRWRISDFTPTPAGSAAPTRAAGYFVLFVDRAPVRPGETLKAICKGDPLERGDRSCPTPSYLAGQLVFPTTSESISLDRVPNLVGNKDRKQLHSFVVVLMDTAGRRIGESAWELDLRLPRIGG